MVNTITDLIYVKDHYEVFFNNGTDNYQAQYNAARGSADIAGVQPFVDEYFTSGNGSPLTGITQLTQDTPVSYTPEQLAYIDKEWHVTELQSQKNNLRTELVELQEFTKQLLNTKDLWTTQPTEYDTIETTLQTDLQTKASEFIAKLTEYRTEKAAFEAMTNPFD